MRQLALTLPDKGRVSEHFNLTLTPQYTAPFAISESKNTMVSVDATADSFLRDAVINLTTGVTRPERLAINQPREGYSRRTGEPVNRWWTAQASRLRCRHLWRWRCAALV